MKVLITKNPEEVGKKAARIIIDFVKKKPDAVLGMATGSSVLYLYREIIKISKKEKVDFSQVKTFNVDDYLGLLKEHHVSHTYFMNKHLFNKINIKKSNIHLPNKRNLKKFTKTIKDLGYLDIQILGIGVNDHIGFNEPGSKINSKDRIIKLTDSTRKVNSRWFNSIKEEPKYAVTMGIASILKSKKIILLADGKEKADAISKALKGHISSKVPASFLRKHKNCLFILDKKAASKLKKKYQ